MAWKHYSRRVTRTSPIARAVIFALAFLGAALGAGTLLYVIFVVGKIGSESDAHRAACTGALVGPALLAAYLWRCSLLALPSRED